MAWTAYLEPGGEARIYGSLEVRLTPGSQLRLRERAGGSLAIAPRAFRGWLAEHGGQDDEDEWLLPLRARKRLTSDLRRFLGQPGLGSRDLGLGRSLLATLEGWPPGDHYGREVPDFLNALVARVLKELRNPGSSSGVPWLRADRPQNGVTRRPYRGINRLFLQTAAKGSPFWFTLDQVRKQGGRVKPGQAPTAVVYFPFSPHPGSEDPGPGPGEELDDFTLMDALGANRARARHRDRKPPAMHRVYNWTQTEGIAEPERSDHGGADLLPPEDRAERIARDYLAREGAPALVEKGSFAFYEFGRGRRGEVLDRVVVPPVRQFRSRAAYYRVLFHELAHSTGHPDRLNRLGLEGRAVDGRWRVAHEELVADMAAAWLMAEASLEVPADEGPDVIDYCQAWLAHLKRDPYVLVSAASQAQRAFDHVIGLEKAAPSPRAVALDWIQNQSGRVASLRAAKGGKLKSNVVELTPSGRKTSLLARTRVARGDSVAGYRFKLSAKDMKAWKGGPGVRKRDRLHSVLLIPTDADGRFDASVAPPVLVAIDRLVDEGLRPSVFKGLRGQRDSVDLVLSRPRGRKTWRLEVSTVPRALRLGVAEILAPREAEDPSATSDA